jgi:hypothetical protein
MMEFDTWLTEADIERLWAVCHGTLPEIYASGEEIDEFARLVTHTAMLKVAGEEYSQAVVQ